MARERIITLRHLSTEIQPFSLKSPSVASSRGSYLGEFDSEDERTAVAHGTNSDSAMDQELRSHLAKEYHHQPTRSYHDDHDNEDEDEEENQNVALIRRHTPSRAGPSRNPYMCIPPRIEVVDTQGIVSCSLDPLEMGKFMDQVTKISTGIDSIEIDLNEHQPSFQTDQTFRFKLYQRIEEEIIPNLVQLQATAFLSGANHPSSNENNPEDTNKVNNQSDGLHHLHSDLSYGNRNHDFIHSFSQDVENPLKREQINLLASKLNLILYRLKDYLNSEKRMLANEIKYEWNKELGRYSLSNHRSATRSTEDASDSDSIEDQNDDDSTNHTLFKLMGIDENDQVSLPVFESNSIEIHKRLNLAVRCSTSYPQARKSSLIILSEFDQIKQIQIELEQINLLIELLDKHSLHCPQSNEPICDDDSSSISLSLDGLDHELKTPNYGKKILSKEDTLKRKETYKKIKFSFNVKHNILNKVDDQFKQDKSESDLESNRNLHSHAVDNKSFANKSFFSIIIHWFYRYRFALLVSTFLSFLLGCGAVGFYFVLRRHDN